MKNLNPQKFSDLAIIKKILQCKNKNIKLFVEKKYDKYHSNFFLHG